MKDIFISDLASYEEGKPFDSFFLLLARQQRTTKAGKPYLNLVLGDKTGQLEGRVWEPNDPRIAKDAEQGDVVKVRGSVALFDGKLQMKVDQLRKATPAETDKSDLLPSTTYDVNGLWSQLRGFIDSFTDPHLKLLLNTLLDDEQIGGKFREAPAAKQLHHAWLGGLLEHVVSLLKLADKVVEHYNALWPDFLYRDLVLTGVILHDIGKIKELKWDAVFEYTQEGVLLGHIQMGYEIASRAMEMQPGFPPRLKTAVLHLILSHHGKLEFGSPKLPMLPEALVLSFVDDLDAKMMAARQAFVKANQEGKSADEFTDKVWALDNRQLLNTKEYLAKEIQSEVKTEKSEENLSLFPPA